ncbi:amidohydrolase family protein, partial [Enterococcus faecium]
ATINGARALRRAHEIGSLAVGKQADIIAISTHGLNFMPPAASVPAIVLQTRPGDVAFVMVAGGVVKRDGKLIGHDLALLR